MKKLFYLLVAVCLFTACSSDDKKQPSQDFTSFTFVYYADVKSSPNCVAAYKKDNKYYKIADLGDLTKGIASKEVRLEDKSIKEVYFFTDYNGVIRADAVYILRENLKNDFVIAENTKGVGVTDKKDPTQYPQ